MVIHTKKKATLHRHVARRGSIKGSNIYTVARGKKMQNFIWKKTYRRSTMHPADRVSRETHYTEMNRKRAQSQAQTKQKIKTKSNTAVLSIGANVAAEQMEGGQEVQQAAYFAREFSRPAASTMAKGAELTRRMSVEKAKRRLKIKKQEAGKQLVKKKVKKTVKTMAKETAKEAAKTVAKTAAKTAATTAAAAAGTAVAPGAGTAAGIAAGYVAGVAVEAKDVQITNRNRKIKFFMDKMKAEENQTDSIGKLVKDLVKKKITFWVKTAAPVVGLLLLLLALSVAMIAVPVVASIGILYNSPFALFLPQLEEGETVPSVTMEKVTEFQNRVNRIAEEHRGCDSGEIVYVNSSNGQEVTNNYYDILAVYMVKYGIGETATIINDISKRWIQRVVDDMCSYTTQVRTVTYESTDEDGKTTTTTEKILTVRVDLKTYKDMADIYGFDKNQRELLEQIMSPEFMGQIGWAGGTDDGTYDPGKCSLTEAEIEAILSSITDPVQRQVCSYALHRVGYPYSQEYRDSGNYYDCSSLAFYAWKSAGVNISHGGSTTAAEEARGLEAAGKNITYSQLQPGDLIFYSFTTNGRYRNISHVAIYVGNGKVVEALNSRVGVIYRDSSSRGSIVTIARPG